MKKCVQCNQIFSDEVVFCPKCGRQLEVQAEEKHFCSKCGQQIEKDVKFCPKCGALNSSYRERNNGQTVVNMPNAASRETERKDDTLQILKEQYLSFSGRLNRKPYIIRSLIVYVVSVILLVLVDLMFEDEFTFDEFGMLTTAPGTAEILFTLIVCAICMVFMISLNVRRLHDLNKTGWLVLLGCVPIANAALSIYVLFFKGTEGSTQYGEDPLQYK